MARWKDTGVYLDGQPIGFLTFGELPIALKPNWVEGQGLAEQAAGLPCVSSRGNGRSSGRIDSSST